MRFTAEIINWYLKWFCLQPFVRLQIEDAVIVVGFWNVSWMWAGFCFVLFPLSNVKGRGGAGGWGVRDGGGGLQVWLAIFHLTPQQTRDPTPAEHPEMRWEYYAGGGTAADVMDRINKSSQSVITKLTLGGEEVREGGGGRWMKLELEVEWTALLSVLERRESRHFNISSSVSSAGLFCLHFLVSFKQVVAPFTDICYKYVNVVLT